jgi:hypothetical protein
MHADRLKDGAVRIPPAIAQNRFQAVTSTPLKATLRPSMRSE